MMMIESRETIRSTGLIWNGRGGYGIYEARLAEGKEDLNFGGTSS